MQCTADYKIMEKLKHLKTLAERGVDGEQESAKAFLDRLMKKYGISESDLHDDLKSRYWFSYGNPFEKRLLLQIIYMVMGNVSVYKWADGRKKKQSGVDCTAADKMDIELNFDFFKRAFEEEFDIFFSAFANKNNLFPRTQSETQDDDVAPDLERAERVQLMMEGMEKHTLSKMLEE